MSYVAYEGLSTPNEVLEKMSDYITRKGYTIVQDLTDDSNIYDRSSNDGKKIVFQDRTNEYFVSLRSANGTNIFGTNDDAQMDSLSADKDIHYYGIGMTVSEGYSKAQRWYNQYNAPLQYRGKDVQGVFMPVTQGTATTVQTRPTKVDYPTPVDNPVKEDYPEAPKRADYPTRPTEPTDPTVVRSDKNASLGRKIAPRITNIHGTDPFSLQYDKDKYGGRGVPLADLLYDSSHQYNKDIVVLFDNNSMRIITSGTEATIENGNAFKNKGIYVNGDGNYKDIIEVFGVEISTLTEQTFMDKWNSMSEQWKEQFSVGSNFNFPFCFIEGKNKADINASLVTATVGSYKEGFNNGIVGIAMPKSVFEKLKNFSKTISDYNTALKQYQSDLATYNKQVAAIDAQYQADLQKYQQECDKIDADYNNKASDYNKYLQKVAVYQAYLTAEDNYITYLKNKNATGITYNLYCNEITKPTDTLIFSLVKQGQKVVEKVAEPPVRPTPPVKPVKAQYPNKPTRPYNQTSADWVQYKADCKKIDDDYNTAMTQYNTDMTKYQQDMTTYDTAFDAYISNLENGVGITYKDDTTSQLFQTTHLIFGNLDKYDTWTGGAYFSGSATRYMMKTAYKVYEDEDESDSAILPVLSSGQYSNTFLRIDIDEAPSDKRGNIYWASSGADNITGKKLSLPIRVKGQSQNGKIPHYLYLQSQGRLDWGRDINTLNCITINMPIYFSVCVDPDAMNLYAPAGAANGIYFISTLNMQTSHIYEIQYPESNILCEIFPMGKRRGYYGFDGISIYQEEEETKTEDNTKASN